MLGSRMEAEIREQPLALARGWGRYREEAARLFGGERFEMVLLAARGSSDHAALYARYLIEVHLGIPVSLAAPSVLTRFGVHVRYPRCLAIGISQSGSAPDVSEVLKAMREQGHATLAITNTAGSRLTEAAEHTLLLGAGEERSIAATKTYTTSLAALYAVVQALGAALPELEAPTDAWLEASREAAEEACGAIVRSQPIFALGRGYSFATANETALKLMECALITAKAYSTADFEHGPKALARHNSAAVVFGGGTDIARQGCEVIAVPDAPVCAEQAPIWQIMFGQWLALLAARARGLDPDGVEHLRKVTETL